MPQMGESVFEGTMTKWLKKVGDTVRRDEPLFEISTDKVDSEIPSPASGILADILVPGRKDHSDQHRRRHHLMEAEASGKESGVTPAKEEASCSGNSRSPESVPSVHPPVAAESRNREDAGRHRPSAPPPAGEQSTKSGFRTYGPHRLFAGWHVKTASTLPWFAEPAWTEELPRTICLHISRSVPRRKGPAPGRNRRSHKGIAAMAVPASNLLAQAASPDAHSRAPRFIGESETVPMSPMRKAISEHMILSKRTSAHVNTVFEVDVSHIVRLREAHRAEFEKREGIALTYTPFFAKALVDTVREFPDPEYFRGGRQAILYKKPINLGIAVALETRPPCARDQGCAAKELHGSGPCNTRPGGTRPNEKAESRTTCRTGRSA